MAILGPLISAGASLLGGIFGQSSQEKMAEQNIKLQKQFAQQGIQWKVADAKKAGVHPLYALGAQTTSFSPVNVGDSLGPALSSAGQDIGRAVSAGMSNNQRASVFEEATQRLTLQRMGLENDLLASKVRLINQPGTGPGLPTGNVAGLALPSGDVVPVGPGAAAQDIENEYGDISALEGGYRWIRDRVPAFVGINGTKTPLFKFNGFEIPAPSSSWWSAARRGGPGTPYGK